MVNKLYQRLRWGTLRRLQDIVYEAPWSNHDLLVGVIMTFMGLVLFVNPNAFEQLRALAYLNTHGKPLYWASLFLSVGIVNLIVTLWCKAPPFAVRLMARMFGAFGFLVLALSTMLFSMATPSLVVYLTLAIWSMWGILRTKASGR